MEIAGLSIGWEWLIGGVPAVALTFWWYQERQRTNSAAETIENVGERARVFTGNLFSAFTSLIASLLLIAVTLGDQLINFLDELLMIASLDPMLTGMLSTGLLGTLGISGLWDVSPWTFFVVVLLLVVGVSVWRRRQVAGGGM